jgi:hypothetical protein
VYQLEVLARRRVHHDQLPWLTAADVAEPQSELSCAVLDVDLVRVLEVVGVDAYVASFERLDERRDDIVILFELHERDCAQARRHGQARAGRPRHDPPDPHQQPNEAEREHDAEHDSHGRAELYAGHPTAASVRELCDCVGGQAGVSHGPCGRMAQR